MEVLNEPFYGDAFVKGWWRSRPHPGGCALHAAIFKAKVGALDAFEPAAERPSIRAGRERTAPNAAFAQDARAKPHYRRAPSLGTVTWW
jgi:hypothetical protein